MLTFSRKREQEKRPLELTKLVKETTKLLRASIPSTTSIRIESDGSSGFILADPTQIEQVLMNLCTNAAHAIGEAPGTIEIEVTDCELPLSGGPEGMKPGPYARLMVRDTGAGIPADIMDKIFDPFFTTKAPGEGTGLGLSVVHGIVKEHDGRIAVESAPGKGAAFSLYFPKVEERVREETPGEEAVAAGHERILFVDDEAPLVEMGQEILADLGYKVESRTSGREALSLLRLDPSRFDLVITDQTMPEMTGIQLASELFAIRPDLPVILCTGFSQLIDEDKTKTAGVRAFAVKPLTKGEIARTIRLVLDGETLLQPALRQSGKSSDGSDAATGNGDKKR
jgi:CheY-like chemotaxis protein